MGLSSSITIILSAIIAILIIIIIVLARVLVRTKVLLLQRHQKPDDTVIYEDIALTDKSKDISTDCNVAYGNIPNIDVS